MLRFGWEQTGCRSCQPGGCQACCALPVVLGPERVADLADRARVRFRAAAEPHPVSGSSNPARTDLNPTQAP
jgi:hypothetical protein